jgi:hypothetical protein
MSRRAGTSEAELIVGMLCSHGLRAAVSADSWFALLVIAGLIGAVGILANSQILIVGAMVVGPA